METHAKIWNGPWHILASMLVSIPLIALTLLGPMEFSIKLHTIKSGWSIVYIEGSQINFQKKILSFSED